MNRFVVVVVGFTFFETNEVGFFSPQKNRVKDFREAIIKYLEAMMESQQQVCKLLLCREESVGAIFSGAPCTRKLVKLGALVNSEIEAKSTVVWLILSSMCIFTLPIIHLVYPQEKFG